MASPHFAFANNLRHCRGKAAAELAKRAATARLPLFWPGAPGLWYRAHHPGRLSALAPRLDWIKVKNPDSPAVRRTREGRW
jgi:hypothetical protein